MDQDYASAVDHAAFVLALRERGVRDTAVLRAMEQVPREAFTLVHLSEHARRDIALPLPCGQTMTAPTTIAAMLIALGVEPGMAVLEIGTGFGYVTALLIRLGASHVHSLERYETLARAARERLSAIPGEVFVDHADGLAEDSVAGAFDRILLNGFVPEPPAHLVDALPPGGRLVTGAPGANGPSLIVVERAPDGRILKQERHSLRLAPLMPGRAIVT